MKPVSTVDGLNWFLPEYEASGALKPVSQFTRDDNLTHANVSIAGLSGNALESAKRKGYYVYTDFYLKTEDDKANVQISYVNPYALENNDYGSDDCSYCLPSYTFELIDNETTIIDNNSVITAGGKKYQIRNVGLNAEKSVRIGFLVNPDYQDSPASSDYEAKNDFYIYEPNADLRSKDIKPGSKDYEERYKQQLDSAVEDAINSLGEFTDSFDEIENNINDIEQKLKEIIEAKVAQKQKFYKSVLEENKIF